MQTNFATCDYSQLQTIPTKSTEGVIKASFPKGWSDNSNWAPVYYTASRFSEGSDTFWRVDVPQRMKQHIQLMHNLPQIGGKDFVYELSLAARGDQAIEIGVRQVNPPYQFIWSTQKSLGTEWQTYRWKFKLRETDPNEVGVWLNITGSPAVMDFKNIQLRQLTSAQMQQQAMAKFPGEGPVNLLRQSRLPLGLQSGWSLDRGLNDADEVQITSMPDATSPTGCAVLHMVSPDKRMLLRGEPIAIDRTWLKHTASVYVRGQGSFEFSVNNQGNILNKTNVSLSPDKGWKRLVIDFDPIVSITPYYLAFAGQGDFAIDGLMMHSGEMAKPYQSQQPVEIALAPTQGQIAAFTRIHFDNEPAEFQYTVTGMPDDAHANLVLTFSNTYGQTHKQIIALNSTANLQGKLNYNVFADHPYGSVRINAHVEDDKSSTISTLNELVMHRLRKPHYWMQDAPNSAFGVHTLATRRHIQMAKAVGINWTRLHDAGTGYIGWYHLEPEPGKWVYRDKELYRYRQYGMKIFGSLGTAPKWASMYPGYDVSSYFDRYYMPKDFNQFAEQYVKPIVKRYAKVIDAWDVWNEPWGTWWCSGYDKTKSGRAGYIQDPDETKSFAQFQKVVYNAVKAVNPDALVAGFNTHISKTGLNWTKGIIQHGATPDADLFSYHQYTHSICGYPDDVVQQGVLSQVAAFPNRKMPYPIWMTEGSPTARQIGEGLYDVTVPGTNEENVNLTSDLLGRFCLSLLASHVERFFLYSMHCHSYFGMTNGHQVLMTEEGYLHPCADALSAMTWFLEDKTFTDHKELVRGVHAYRFVGQSGKVTVLSIAPGKHDDYVLPQTKGTNYFDLYGNPLDSGSLLGVTLVYVVN
jgi:hypothetical protein